MRALVPNWLLVCTFLAFAPFTPQSAAFDILEAKKLFLKGEYEKVIQQTGEAIENNERGEEVRLLHAEALWTVGRYLEAVDAINETRRMYYYSVRARLLGYEIYRSAGDLKKAQEVLDEINLLGGSRRWGYRDAIDVVALGQAAIILGADPRLVLENFFGAAKKADPEMREVYIASGQLALEKHDFALASQSFQEGLKKFKDDPDMLYGMAAALEPSDRKAMLGMLEKALTENPNHVRARLLVVDHLVDAEEYEGAVDELNRIEKVNPNHPKMWAYRAVIAHLRNEAEEEEKAREAGLKFWETNPVVDHLIGQKLSQKYRFAEGAEYQRRALKFAPDYLPAKIQLAQDFLRLGIEEEGWPLADEVFKEDAYDIAAYNLVTLHDTLRKFATLTNEHFIVRMSEHEASIYGQEALELLEESRQQLTKKYGLELTKPVTVEIFPEQKDFAVRTFGMPGGEGYLGVCFGNVITANSPASQAMNWQSVLWHEFCHVVTLNLTRNRMPRWLSEGISVYEERRASPRWGEQINPRYREMILEGEMKPISELSAAFMAPPSGLHLQFAYYQSSLVVEFLIERYGLEPLRAILKDLGEGIPINDALVAHTAPMEELEKDFEEFAEAVAKEMGPDTRWSKPDRDRRGNLDGAWATLHPDNIYVLQEKAEKLMEEEDWEAAIEVLEKLIEVYPSQNGVDNAYGMLAAIYRETDEIEKEKKALNDLVRWDSEAQEALLRLIEIETLQEDYENLRKHARLLMEVNPLLPQAHRALALADEADELPREAVRSYRAVLKLNPPDPADVHYRVASLLHGEGDPDAKRHILLALQDAPRFRDGHKLLLKIIGQESEGDAGEQETPEGDGNAESEE